MTITGRLDPFPLISAKPQRLSTTERVIFWTIVLAPLWWLTGVQTLLYPSMVAGLVLLNLNWTKLYDLRLPSAAWGWLFMSLTMLWTAILGLNRVDYDPVQAASVLVTLFKSYLLILGCLVLPCLTPIRLSLVTRAVSWYAVGGLAVLGLELILLVLLRNGGGESFLPIFARLIPGDKVTLIIHLATFQDFFGRPVPRTGLYTPDAPILGVCSIMFFLVCLGETQRWLRITALTGCVAMLLISQSRIAWVTFPTALFLLALFRQGFMRQGMLWMAAMVSLFCTVMGKSLVEFLTQPMAVFTSARPESSRDRATVIQATIEAWQQKPWFGWGTIQGSVKWYIYDIPLGSFSTYPAILYMHGIFGFCVFVMALLLSVMSVGRGAIAGDPESKRALVGLLSLYFLCNATPLSWMITCFWSFFLWLGILIAPEQRSGEKKRGGMVGSGDW
jgi:hypothetical protein